MRGRGATTTATETRPLCHRDGRSCSQPDNARFRTMVLLRDAAAPAAGSMPARRPSGRTGAAVRRLQLMQQSPPGGRLPTTVGPWSHPHSSGFDTVTRRKDRLCQAIRRQGQKVAWQDHSKTAPSITWRSSGSGTDQRRGCYVARESPPQGGRNSLSLGSDDGLAVASTAARLAITNAAVYRTRTAFIRLKPEQNTCS